MLQGATPSRVRYGMAFGPAKYARSHQETIRKSWPIAVGWVDVPMMAKVMAGGELSAPTWVEEQYILDLEREAFLSLCGEEKTQQRMWNLLQTGKVLRN